jgi:DNA helicase TIP49 (TBP-interacting protein)
MKMIKRGKIAGRAILLAGRPGTGKAVQAHNLLVRTLRSLRSLGRKCFRLK